MIGRMQLGELLEKQKNNGKTAIKHAGNQISYTDWHQKSKRISDKINSLSPLNGESKNIAVFLPNSIEYAIAYFSIVFSKKVVVPIGVTLGSDEIKNTLEYAEIDLIVTTGKYKDLLLGVLSDYAHSISLLLMDADGDNIINLEKNEKSARREACDGYDEVAILLHTSGSASSPKRVMLTHSNLIDNIQSNIISLGLTENDITLICLPMYFGYCNTAQFLTHLYLGASMVIMDGIFTPLKFFKTVQKENITNFTAVPTMLLLLLAYENFKKYSCKSLKYICFGGGPMPKDKLKRLIEKYDSVGFVQTYGQTEASPRVTALMPEDSLEKIGSVGKPIPNVSVKIVDGRGIESKENEIGEVIVEGKNVMKGYFKNEKTTAETIIDGWLHTGDLGYKDEDGYLYITGRMKNVIISGGFNIYPEEIEEVLSGYPGIKEVRVVGEAHDLLIEAPVAKIVASGAGIPNKKDMREYCLKRLAAYKVPIRFDVVEKLEKTHNGKIKRH